ncbi:hypothetical protein MHK_010904 [Candidatus Magnetomorum sp. HK-1]|nr:hypothetical protein MHK_010904 [Candidatus Magnetomorum sp. HK-1]
MEQLLQWKIFIYHAHTGPYSGPPYSNMYDTGKVSMITTFFRAGSMAENAELTNYAHEGIEWYTNGVRDYTSSLDQPWAKIKGILYSRIHHAISYLPANSDPINGVCINYQGNPQDELPATLCSSGTAINISGTGPWTWACTGINGGTSDLNCSAELNFGDGIIEVSIANSSDDAEESNITGETHLTSTDLELTSDSGYAQTIGLRFEGINIEPGVSIKNAYIQFAVDEISTEETSLEIRAEASDNSETFVNKVNNITSRSTTSNYVLWNNIPEWIVLDQRSSDQRAPDLSTIVQEVINRDNWISGNAFSFIISGEGSRVAVSSNRYNTTLQPMLHLEFDTETQDYRSVGLSDAILVLKILSKIPILIFTSTLI